MRSLPGYAISVPDSEATFAVYSGFCALFGVCVVLLLAAIGMMRVFSAITSRKGRFVEIRETISKHVDESAVDEDEEDLFEWLEKGFNSLEVRYIVHRIKKNPLSREEQ